MSTIKNKLSVGAVALALSPIVLAGTEPYFNPLTQSTAVATVNHVNELNSPWQVPAGISQTNLMSMLEVESDVTQSIQRVDAGTSASMFDMLAYDPKGNYIFIPHETPFGAGLSRYDLKNDRSDLLFAGDQAAANCSSQSDCPEWDYDFGAFDPARFTPNGTVIMGEEWAGRGRIVEVMDPFGPAPLDPSASSLQEGVDYRILNSIAKVAHEGINFSEKYENEVIYFIDEWNSGSIYALVLKKKGDYAKGGQTFVLSVDAFAATGGDAAANWNEGPNASAERFGRATWVPLTDKNGNPLPGVTDPFRDGPTQDPRFNAATRGGRGAADDVGGTPYGRPEDMEISTLPNGNEILYIATTSEQAIISIEILGGNKAYVRQFASRATPKNVGFPETTGTLDSPDNLAQDALGNIYVIEDQPNSGSVGGDVWFVRDTDNDGVAESLDHFMSLQVNGSESTGMIFSPKDPSKFVLAVMHPTSVDISVNNGFGDAIWEFDLQDVVPPTCDDHRGRFGDVYSWKKRQWVRTCSRDYDYNFVKMLEWAGKPKSKHSRW